ncbi:MAG: TRAP transporter substrate-binding protein DctP [Alphaproteobacteria bacterium]
MKRIAASCLAIGVCLGAAGASAADPVTIKISDHFPVNHIIPTTITKPWMARAGELSAAKIKFQHFPAQQLVKQTDALPAMQRRIVDIAFVIPGLFPTEFELTGVAFLPGGYSTIAEGSAALQRLVTHTAIRAEFAKAGAEPLLIVPFDAYEILSRDRLIRQPEDARGLRLRVAGDGQVAAARALGATPVSIGAPEIYTAVQRGTLDGSLFPYSVATSYRMNEVAKFGTVGANVAYGHGIYCASPEFWTALDATYRDTLVRAATESAQPGFKAMDDTTLSTIESFRKGGMTLVQVDQLPGGREAWDAALRPVREQWAADMEAKGRPGKAVLRAWDEALKAAR